MTVRVVERCLFDPGLLGHPASGLYLCFGNTLDPSGVHCSHSSVQEDIGGDFNWWHSWWTIISRGFQSVEYCDGQPGHLRYYLVPSSVARNRRLASIDIDSISQMLWSP